MSNYTISLQIKDMASNCESVLLERLKGSSVSFTMELDESTDVAGLAIVVFVRYLVEECVHEDVVVPTY